MTSDSGIPAGQLNAPQVPRTPSQAVSRWYEVTLLALIIHQIDAAFWQEWSMFGVPGGVQGFLVFNAVAVGAILVGYRELLLGGRWAPHAVVLCGALGLATAGLHIGFAIAGREEFHLPLSILVIVLCGVAGAVLLGFVKRVSTAGRNESR
ncbi:DUF6713 family protein [Leucobacter sp. G161]|uniref:DUF6713 family protein n=1 Tax=Leucobacter sp. G161 TaxID=663704 RepID=UPI001910FE77|nr:DUF6713 family protein [Leucobacter sp. G161]